MRVGLAAQYAIPMCGMLMGNTMSGVSQALNSLLIEFAEQPENIELLLALGATRGEALTQVIHFDTNPNNLSGTNFPCFTRESC